jgi:NAD(P)-dependent dehydrogenase (short-subunit alcohol dehydrogenase family)
MKRMKVNLENKVALITGAGGGIGGGIAHLFSQNGAMVVVNDIDAGRGQQVVDEIHASGGRAAFLKADVGNRQEVQGMMDQAVEEYGKIDILVNNAGINIGMNARGPIHEFPDEMWDKILNVDLDGVYYCSKAALKTMIPNHSGKIINIGSIAGAVPLRNQCAFVAAKAGVIHLTKAMAIELAPYGILVNVILPGSTLVPGMMESMYADGRYESIMSHIPLKRPGTPEDIAYGALYLACDASGYVTGSVLTIDGGWTSGFARDW